ncbi:uncharacterized protein OCT59_007550 [Rhizophagus irregularis]|uniref:uncharacterized protein n=1 Tax=Rhizophagus irregularis TaxID=588596 RepID=UPI00333393CE|nr:hypothetical protein OCT59_007550 [Rhizophagus irregularis]
MGSKRRPNKEKTLTGEWRCTYFLREVLEKEDLRNFKRGKCRDLQSLLFTGRMKNFLKGVFEKEFIFSLSRSSLY